VNRSVIDTAFNSIIGNNKIPSNIFANPALGIDIRTQAPTQHNQSIVINTAHTIGINCCRCAALSQIPGADSILSLLKSGQGLVSEIKGAAKLLDQAKNLPGVGSC
jgi:hypothetical protein